MVDRTNAQRTISGVVQESNRGLNGMEQTLAKLHALTEDDKTEAAMLRSRIDEQSQLIMILKKRADDATVRLQTLEKINCELTDFRESANDQLQNEIRKFNLLDKRFGELAANHEEMIKFKDEYKRVNRDLREENSRVKEENAKLFSQAILDKNQQIDELDRKCTTLKSQYSSIELKHRHLQQELRQKDETHRKEMQNLQDSHKSQTTELQRRLQDAEERLKGANYKLQQQIDSKQSASTEATQKIAQLTKEKDELLDLAMQRGKLITKEQAENKILQRKVEEMEKVVKKMDEKFKAETNAVNANLQVRKLRDDLADANIRYNDMIKEFEAFKKHSNGLLQKERELNERLRHLVG